MALRTREDIERYFEPTTDPRMRAMQLQVAQFALHAIGPDARDKLLKESLQKSIRHARKQAREQALKQGIQQGLALLLERKLGRQLSEDEHRTLQHRLDALGPDRLADVLADFKPKALAAWLADPEAR